MCVIHSNESATRIDSLQSRHTIFPLLRLIGRPAAGRREQHFSSSSSFRVESCSIIQRRSFGESVVVISTWRQEEEFLFLFMCVCVYKYIGERRQDEEEEAVSNRLLIIGRAGWTDAMTWRPCHSPQENKKILSTRSCLFVSFECGACNLFFYFWFCRL